MQNWNVALMDEQGIVDAKRELPHVLACRLLHPTACDQGWIQGLEGTFQSPVETKAVLEGLSIDQLAELESFFTRRDCHYRSRLMHDDPGVRVLYKKILWKD